MATIPERLATLEAQQQDLSADLTTVVETTANIEKTLNELIGARKALVWVFGAVATVTGMIISWLGLHKQ